MSSVKDLGEPGWTRSPLSVKECKVIREDGHSIATIRPAPFQTVAEVWANATLFAAAPELAGAVREYLERLEDEVVRAKRNVDARMARHEDQYGGICDEAWRDLSRPANVAELALSAASPLYAALAKAYGKEEG